MPVILLKVLVIFLHLLVVVQCCVVMVDGVVVHGILRVSQRIIYEDRPEKLVCFLEFCLFALSTTKSLLLIQILDEDVLRLFDEPVAAAARAAFCIGTD